VKLDSEFLLDDLLVRRSTAYPCASGRQRVRLALENLLAAIEAVLAAPGTLRRAFIAAGPEVLTVAEMIAAMRHGARAPA